MFAALATGNPVIIKPHSNAILPAAITVKIAREVLAEAGLDPNLVSLAVVEKRADTQALATHPAVKSIDFTGSNVFGKWLLDNARQANVYAELAGVNNVVIESTDQYKAMLRNLAFTLSLYSGQMCTTTQAILVPAGGIDTDQGHKSFDEVAADLGTAIDRFLGDINVATAVLGAIQSEATLARIAEAGEYGHIVLPSKKLEHPEFPKAEVRTPVLLSCDAADEKSYMEERFGPISFVVKVADGAAAIAPLGTHRQGTRRTHRRPLFDRAGCHRRDDRRHPARGRGTVDQPHRRRVRKPVGSLLRLPRHRRQPSANASYSDSAFVANRFRVIQRRYHAA